MGTALISNLDATTETRHDRAGQEVMGRVNEKLVTIFHRQYETERGGGEGERERGREGGGERDRERELSAYRTLVHSETQSSKPV